MTMFGEMDIEIVESAETERAPKGGETTTTPSRKAKRRMRRRRTRRSTSPWGAQPYRRPASPALPERWGRGAAEPRGRIEIAKRIEEGKKDIATVVYGLPMTLEFVLNLRDQLKNSKIDVRRLCRSLNGRRLRKRPSEL